MKRTYEPGKEYQIRQKSERRKEPEELEDTEVDEDGTDKQPRLSFYFESSSIKQNTDRERVLDEVDRVEQLITLNLQKINENLMQSNNIVSNKLIPSLEAFNKNSNKIYNNISHIKEFFENAANVNILTKKDIGLQQMNDSDNSQDRTGDSDENLKRVGESSDFERNRSANNITSELSEFKDIKDRYKQNLESAGEKDVSVTHTATTLKLNKLPDYLKDNSNSIGTETFLRDFRMNADDESTGKHLKQQNIAAHTPEREAEGDRENTGPSEDNLANSYVKEIMAGYESPPWEEPPVLQSSKFTSGHTKKRKRRPSSAHGRDQRQSSNEVGDRSMSETNKDTRTRGKDEQEEEEEEEEEEEVSIRFPSSPKYGAGGKLLRTDKGRQKALDFARSEMMKNHPILSLQPQEKSMRKPVANTQDPFDSTGERYDTTNSTLDDAPELMSELLSRRRQQREDAD